jgi:copper chaperone CopZ
MLNRRTLLTLLAASLAWPWAPASRAGDAVVTVITVEKMHCGGCAKRLAARIKTVSGVAEGRANVARKSLTVIHRNGASVSPRALWLAVEQARDRPLRLAGPDGVFDSEPSS